VIAFVGSDEKVGWCRKELGFDHVFNYKTSKFSDAITSVAPNGVDLFFDNVSKINLRFFSDQKF
jgi:NADPH-dependent curcumin reductase CurA